MDSLGMAFPFIGFLSFAICALKRRNDAKIWVYFMKTNYTELNRANCTHLFAALQTRPQLFKERIVISYPADIIAIQRTTDFDLHHFRSVVRSLNISCHPARRNPTDKTNIHIKVGENFYIHWIKLLLFKKGHGYLNNPQQFSWPIETTYQEM